MVEKSKLTGYAYMELSEYKELDNEVLERHLQTFKSNVEPDLKKMEYEKEKGARKVSRLLLD